MFIFLNNILILKIYVHLFNTVRNENNNNNNKKRKFYFFNVLFKTN